jgi:hypothetical protein
MSIGLDEAAWRWVKLALGGLFILGGIALLMVLEPFETIKFARLETSGSFVNGIVKTVRVSDRQAPRSSFIGSYALFRGLGASRMTSAGAALAQRRGSKTTYYDIGYEFPARGGRFGGMAHVAFDRSDVLREGTSVSVLADLSEPAIHRLPAFSRPTSMSTAVAGFGLSLVAIAAGGLFVWLGMAQPAVAARSTFAAAPPAATQSPSRRLPRAEGGQHHPLPNTAQRMNDVAARKPRDFATRQRVG